VDEATVRQHAEAHGAAVVRGDLRAAGGDLEGDALAQAADVMKQLPRELDGAEVETIELGDDVAEVRTRYFGEGRSEVVTSQWEGREGRPKITSMRVA